MLQRDFDDVIWGHFPTDIQALRTDHHDPADNIPEAEREAVVGRMLSVGRVIPPFVYFGYGPFGNHRWLNMMGHSYTYGFNDPRNAGLVSLPVHLWDKIGPPPGSFPTVIIDENDPEGTLARARTLYPPPVVASPPPLNSPRSPVGGPVWAKIDNLDAFFANFPESNGAIPGTEISVGGVKYRFHALGSAMTGAQGGFWLRLG